MENMNDFRVAVGFGMGTSKIDNELIEEAFIMGAGAATGMIMALLDLEPAVAMDVASKVYNAVEMVMDENG